MRTTRELDKSLLRRLRDEDYEQGVPLRTLLHRVIQRGLDVSIWHRKSRIEHQWSGSGSRVREFISSNHHDSRALVKTRKLSAKWRSGADY